MFGGLGTRLGRKGTQHRQFMGINNNYEFLLPKAVCCCLQICNFCFDETQYTKYGSKMTQHNQVIGINNKYKFLLPEAVCCFLQTCNSCFDENLS